MDLNLANILFELNSERPVSLIPSLYDEIRRFDYYFKCVSCPHVCLDCRFCDVESGSCPHRNIFGQILSTDPDIVRKHQKPPLPFVFKISNMDSNISCIELNVIIIGSAMQHVSLFIEAIYRMIESVAVAAGTALQVSDSWSLDYRAERHGFNAASQELIILSAMEILQAPCQSDMVRICTKSPLRLVSNGSIVRSFDFATFLRSQLRRCSSLFAYYGEGELEMDYVFLSGAAERVSSLCSNFAFSMPLWTKRPALSGIQGSGEFTDLADGMIPLLMLGSYMNAGKGSSWGFGAYSIEAI